MILQRVTHVCAMACVSLGARSHVFCISDGETSSIKYEVYILQLLRGAWEMDGGGQQWHVPARNAPTYGPT